MRDLKLLFQKRIGKIAMLLLAFIAILLVVSGTMEGVVGGLSMAMALPVAIKSGFAYKSSEDFSKLTDVEKSEYLKNKQHYEAEITAALIKDAEEKDLIIKDLQTSAEALTAKLQGMAGTQSKQVKESFIDVVKKHTKDFEQLFEGGNGFKMSVNKATFIPGDVENDTHGNRLNTIDSDPSGYKSWVDTLFGTEGWVPNANGKFIFYDEKVEDLVRAAKEYALTGSATPDESTYVLEENELTVKLIADFIGVNEFALSDTNRIIALQNRLENFLRTNIQRKRQAMYMTGDATTINQFSGLVKLTPAFDYATYGAIATNKVQTANIVDLVRAMKTEIEKANQDTYKCDYVLINPSDLKKVRDLKDADDLYIFPTSIADNQLFDGITTVISTGYIAEGTLIVGDSRFPKRIDDPNIELKMSQDTEGLKTFSYLMRIHLRSALLIRKIYLGAQSKCTNITAALAALTV